MLLPLLISFILLFQSHVVDITAARCNTSGHFTNGFLEIASGDLSCTDSKWGFPEIKISDGALVRNFELATNDTQKNKLAVFKEKLITMHDPAIKSILEQVAIGEKLILAKTVEYSEYLKFQEGYVNCVKGLSKSTIAEVNGFFK